MEPQTAEKWILVDGMNIAHDGLRRPSLVQLKSQIDALIDRFPDRQIQVLLDTSFHRKLESRQQKDEFRGCRDNGYRGSDWQVVGGGEADVHLLNYADGLDVLVCTFDNFTEWQEEFPWFLDKNRSHWADA